MTLPAPSLHSRIFLAAIALTLLAAGIPALIAHRHIYNAHLEYSVKEAVKLVSLISDILPGDITEDISGDISENISGGTFATNLAKISGSAKNLGWRISIIGAEGTVLWDSHFLACGKNIDEIDSLDDLDNHGDRPEIEAAGKLGQGTSVRYSNSLEKESIYAAIARADKSIIRLSMPLEDIRQTFKDMAAPLILIFSLIAALCLILSFIFASRIRNSLREMAESVLAISSTASRARLHSPPYAEFSTLASAVNNMADNIEEQVRDLRDKKNQLSTILQSLNEGLLTVAADGRIRSWNKALEEMFPDIVHARGRPLIEAIPLAALQLRLDKILADRDFPPASVTATSATPPIAFEMPRGRFLLAHISRSKSVSEFLGAVILIYDASELMRLERVRRDFVSNVSHELRTPLTAISGYAEMLCEAGETGQGGQDAKKQEFATVIYRHARAMSKIIDSLLHLSRLEDKNEAIELGAIYLRPLIEEVLNSFVSIAEEKKLSFSLNIADNMQVMANAPLLEQVLRNLLDNACRCCPEAGKEAGKISLAAERQGEEIIIMVADNGPGIPKEEQKRIFERFYQIKKERNSGTSGIGLAICRHIIERHGGKIWAESPHGDYSAAMFFTLKSA